MLTKNEQKFIKSLRIKKYRLREKHFLVEGTKSIEELLKSDFEIDILVLSDEGFSTIQKKRNFRLELVSESLLSQLGTFKTNNSGLAVVKMKEQVSFNCHLDDYLFALDGVGDPGNLGTIVRTLDWFGFKELLCSKDCAEFYHPKTIASTMGSFTRVKVYYENLQEILPKLKGPIYSADAKGISMYDVDDLLTGTIVIGSESHGIRPEINDMIAQRIAIPKYGTAESLNVGIATGILACYLRILK
ncbi:MAG: RNA methyltransferase [Bacteroidota bacterium]